MRLVFLILFLVAAVSFSVNAAAGGKMAIKDGSEVAFDYTLTVDGKVMDSSMGRTPLEYKQGDNQLIPGLTKQMAGLKEGDEKNIVVRPEE
ncbi:MAG: FKBP-type peptidyl-prolyl cis-trans isomerase, partial [Candidatus Omnitrophica bacterium]|nr:FKBP-type peptidyl-prolyl cis-trans isomerase [Candidatus Omnitrophota bacterium]